MSFAPSGQFAQPPGPSEELIHASARRIIRWPGTTIQFAAFDPCTATGDQTGASAFQKLSLNEELCRPKRIVIETSPAGRCTWRFVPNARREHGVENEGFWPRVVLFYGQPLTLTQDHWDFFKLDRELECVVRLPPRLSTIDPRTDAPSTPTPLRPASRPVSPKATPIIGAKRRASESTLSCQPSGSNSDGQGRKKARSYIEDYVSPAEGDGRGEIEREDEDDEEEVNDMVIDEGPRLARRQASARLRKVRANNEEARQKCRQARDRRKAKNTQVVVDEDEDDTMSWSECPVPESTSLPTQAMSSPAAKRKIGCFSDAGEESNSSDKDDDQKPHFKPYEKTGQNKRYRTASPFALRNQFGVKRHKRAAARKEEIDRRKQARSEALNARLMKAIYEEAAEELSQSTPSTPTVSRENGTPRPPSPHVEHSATSSGLSPSPERNHFQSKQSRSSQETPVDDDVEAQRRVAIEESRRKIAELEKDRPLWEEQARKRAAREAEEMAAAEARRKARIAKQESSPQKADIRPKSAEQQAKDTEGERRRKAEEQRRAQEDAAAQLRERRKRARENAVRKAKTFSSRPWNRVTALDHYMNLSESFDKLNFSKGDVIVFETIPWPILSPPGSFSVEDINWQAVEAFFTEISLCCSMEEYKAVVVMSHKRFHPDRWSARKVLGCVEDEVERECLDAAAKTVAQALTPIWEKVTGR